MLIALSILAAVIVLFTIVVFTLTHIVFDAGKSAIDKRY